jgi:hypothetical protein
MNTVFLPPDPPAKVSGQLMSSVPTPVPTQLIASSAANADRLGEAAAAPAEAPPPRAETGWDAYDVWRRFIKDARDRRQQQE